VLFGVFGSHFRRNLLPRPSELKFSNIWSVVLHHMGLGPSAGPEGDSYNLLQRLTYLFLLFVLFPLVIWTGLAMSPAFVSAWPQTVVLLGGRQTARTLHFFLSVALVAFVAVHVIMVWRAGFWSRVRAMITGGSQ
jgi:thiosulfate reductase cytochrome b subunit